MGLKPNPIFKSDYEGQPLSQGRCLEGQGYTLLKRINCISFPGSSVLLEGDGFTVLETEVLVKRRTDTGQEQTLKTSLYGPTITYPP